MIRKTTDQVHIRFPVDDLTQLFGPQYKTKIASDYIANLCRACIHALVVQLAYERAELGRVNDILTPEAEPC